MPGGQAGQSASCAGRPGPGGGGRRPAAGPSSGARRPRRPGRSCPGGRRRRSPRRAVRCSSDAIVRPTGLATPSRSTWCSSARCRARRARRPHSPSGSISASSRPWWSRQPLMGDGGGPGRHRLLQPERPQGADAVAGRACRSRRPQPASRSIQLGREPRPGPAPWPAPARPAGPRTEIRAPRDISSQVFLPCPWGCACC